VWRLAHKAKRLRISRSKTKYIKYEFDKREQVDETRSVMTISGDEVNEVYSFKYLVSFIQNNSGFDLDVKHRINCG